MYFVLIFGHCFLTKNFSKSYLYVFVLSIKQNWFYKNFHDSGVVGRRKLTDSSLSNIFNLLLTGLQYTLLFECHDFGLKCLVTVMPKCPATKINNKCIKFSHF